MKKTPTKEESKNKGAYKKRQIWYLPRPFILEEVRTRTLAVFSAFLVFIILISLITWSAFAEIKEKTITVGELIPVGRVKITQHLEGGIVKKIFVNNHSVVKKGQAIILLDKTAFSSELEQLNARKTNLKLDILRLRSYIDNKDFLKKNADDFNNQSLINEQALLAIQNKARFSEKSILQFQLISQTEEIEKLKNKIANIKKSIHLLNLEVIMYEKLIKKGYVSKRDYLKTLREKTEQQSELQSLESEFKQAKQKLLETKSSLETLVSKLKQDAAKQLDKKYAELAEVKHQLTKLKDKVKRTTITASSSGEIKGLEVTLGQVIPEGGELFSVVPKDMDLQAEVKISPKDIGHLFLGDKALVKLTAYDFSRYGAIEGKLVALSATTFKDEKNNSYYKGLIKLNHQALNQQHLLKAGMTLQADIITGHKTLLQYLLKPIHVTISHSFYER